MRLIRMVINPFTILVVIALLLFILSLFVHQYPLVPVGCILLCAALLVVS